MLKPDPTNFKHIGISAAMSSAKIQKFPRTIYLSYLYPWNRRAAQHLQHYETERSESER